MATLIEFRKNFSDFLEATKIHFGFLIRDYGFSITDPHYAKYECFIDFQRTDCRVGVTYELTSIPFCEIRLNINGKWKSISTNQLFKKAAQSLTPPQIKLIRSKLERSMDSALGAYGELIRIFLNEQPKSLA